MWTIILQCRVAANLQFVWMCVLISLGKIHMSQDAELRDCCLVAKWCLPLYNPMDCSTPVSPVLDYLPEFAQIHVCWVGDAIQPSYPLPPSSPFAFSLSQHYQSFQSIQGWFPLGLAGFISLLSKGLSRVYSRSQFESINSSALSLLYSPVLTSIHDYWKIHSYDYQSLVSKVMSLLFNTLYLW